MLMRLQRKRWNKEGGRWQRIDSYKEEMYEVKKEAPVSKLKNSEE